jgi:signal transduction histidine kinase
MRQLTDVSHAIADLASIDEVLQLAVERAVEILPAAKACLLISDAQGVVGVRAAAGVDPQVAETFRAPLDERLLVSLAAALLVSGENKLVAVPLILRGEVTGLLVAARSGHERPTEEDEWLLTALADQTVVALDNARLGKEAHRREQELGVLSAAKSARERQLAMVVHDVRSPLAAILLFVKVLESGNPGALTNKQLGILNRLRSTCWHIDELLSSVLELAIVESGGVKLSRSAVAVQPIMHEAVVVSGAAAYEQALTLTIHQSDLVVYADANRVRQVLVNFISNAVKHTPRGGTIALRGVTEMRDDRRWGIISVTDTGPGIPPEEQDAIFEPYYRVGRIASVSEGGAGLGLAISRELARRMGGDVGVRSVPGQGATLELRLPLEPPR